MISVDAVVCLALCVPAGYLLTWCRLHLWS